jgi:hypothetical protein
MTRLQALKEMALKVEAGEFDAVPGGAKYPMFNAFMDVAERAFGMYEPVGLPRLSWEAYKGSLDAAQDLHEAVLPNRYWNLAEWDGAWTCQIPLSTFKRHEATSEYSAARAWLLAILKALIAQEETNT